MSDSFCSKFCERIVTVLKIIDSHEDTENSLKFTLQDSQIIGKE